MTHTSAAPGVPASSRKLSRPVPAPVSPLLPLILTILFLLLPMSRHARAQGDGDERNHESDARPEADARVEEQLAGQISVAQAANRIAKAIRAAYPGISSLLIYNDGDIRLLLVYGAATKRIDAYTTRYANLAAAEFAALAADPAWTGPGAPCDEAAFAKERAEVRDVRNAAADSPRVAHDSGVKLGGTLALFRADLNMRRSAPDAGGSVVVTEVFRALREQYGGSIALYYPTEIPPGFDPTRDSRLLDKLEALFNAKANAESAAAQVAQRVADKRELIARLEKCRTAADSAQAALQKLLGEQQKRSDDIDRAILLGPKGGPTAAQKARRQEARARLADLRARLEPRVASLWPVRERLGDDVRRLEKHLAALGGASGPLAALNAQAELLAKDLTKADDDGGLDPLAAFMRAEMIQKFMQDNDAYWLKLRVVAAGGGARVRSNLLADLFKGGGRVWYSGASIVEYHLYDRLGRSLLSDTTNSYEEYREAKDFKKLADDRDEVDQR